MNPQCARCKKTVYPMEKLNCLDKVCSCSMLCACLCCEHLGFITFNGVVLVDFVFAVSLLYLTSTGIRDVLPARPAT